MTTDQMATDNPVWGAPAPEPRRWGVRETATAVGVAAVIAAFGGAAIYAATGSNSPPMGAPHQAFGPGAIPGGPGAVPGGPGGPPGVGVHGPAADPAGATSLHGEIVVPDGSGGYTTVLTQTGTVTAISATSITARSDDGYTQTYAIPAAVGGVTPPLAVGDPVTIDATRTDQTATVSTIGSARGR